MALQRTIRWTNDSVLRLAGNADPISVIEAKARDLVLRAKDAGWTGPPYNPFAIADLLKIPVEANVDVADARTVPCEGGLRIQFNPTQIRERVRFSMAHEIAHTLFPDVAEKVRNRGRAHDTPDDWQLEMLCNLAASEFVMPLGSLLPSNDLPSLEQLLIDRRKFDVSVEAYLIRIAKTTSLPVVLFCASPRVSEGRLKEYRIDYALGSRSAAVPTIFGKAIPKDSVVYNCTAIGRTDHAHESWIGEPNQQIECVGISAYPGVIYPRVMGLIRLGSTSAKRLQVKYLHGDVLGGSAKGPKIVAQLVNDQARVWGGGVAKASAKKYPKAQQVFSEWITSLPRSERLGRVHVVQVEDQLKLASIVAQAGYGPSLLPRIKYAALESGLAAIRDTALETRSSVHMPRIGIGASGGQWPIVEELIRDSLIDYGIQVTVYDLPPRREQGALDLSLEHP